MLQTDYICVIEICREGVGRLQVIWARCIGLRLACYFLFNQLKSKYYENNNESCNF